MGLNRQLAAIMFTDIEGYTSMMQENEELAIKVKDRHRSVLQDRHKEFSGSIIQYYGDGTLSIFQSAVQAVQCALTMQQSFRNSPAVPVRIGLHMGDIIHNDEGIFGDGVNLASRIESLGVAGSVLMSDKINDEIMNHPGLKTYSVGVYEFKNIRKPVEVYALDHEELVKPGPNSLKGKTIDKKNTPVKREKKTALKSIAILPFENMSNNPEEDYFSSGIAEEILNSLSNLKELRVANRSSSFRYNTKDATLQEIGEKLGVSSVLEGSVRRQGKRLRVTVQLVNVEDGFHLWSEKYDGSMDDIFAIQDKIALSTTEKLKVTLLQRPTGRTHRTQTSNHEAYEVYLKGRHLMNKRGIHIPAAVKCFEQAIEMDPMLAQAHAGLADGNLMMAFYGMIASEKVIYKAKKAAETAISINGELCEPYCSLGCYYTIFNWNWKLAEKKFQKALELNPSHAQSHYWYGNLYLSWAKGDFFRAETHGRIAIELEPHNSLCYSVYASILSASGKFEESIKACNAALKLDKTSFLAYLFKGWNLLHLRRYNEAVSDFEHLMDISHRHQFSQNALIMAYCVIWRFDKARALLNEFDERAKGEYIACTIRGLSAAYMDDFDRAFYYFDQAFLAKDGMLLSLKYEHWVPATLKADPRFKVLLDKIGFPEEE